MSIPYGRTYGATLRAKKLVIVRCQHCHCEYVYSMHLIGTGSGFSLLFSDNEGAEEEAVAEARRDLKRQVEEEIEMVACPDCGCYQPNMVAVAKRRRLRRGLGIGLTVSILVLGVGMYAYGWRSDGFDYGGTISAFACAIGCALGATILALASYKRHDPNRGLSTEELAKRAALTRGVHRFEFEAICPGEAEPQASGAMLGAGQRDEEAALRRMRAWWKLRGWAPGKIASELNREGYRTNEGNIWQKDMVRCALYLHKTRGSPLKRALDENIGCLGILAIVAGVLIFLIWRGYNGWTVLLLALTIGFAGYLIRNTYRRYLQLKARAERQRHQ